MTHIAVVDDDTDMLAVLADTISAEGYVVSTFETGPAMLEAMGSQNFDLLLLDLKLKNDSGLRVAEAVRATSLIPIMMLTGKGDETDLILGLEMVADDYLMKPFNSRELLARVRALLRRSQQSGAQVVEVENTTKLYFHGWCLDVDLRMLSNQKQQQVQLTFGEFTLLSILVNAPNKVFSRNELLEKTHGMLTESFDRTIDVLILRLRRKLEENPKLPGIILTERGIGYRLVGPVTRR